jgi:hypothetical protein
MDKPKRYVYVITGLQEDPDCGCWIACNDERGCFSTLEKAQAELENIFQEGKEEAEANDFTFNYHKYENQFTGNYDEFIYIEYTIHRMIVN